MVGVLLDRKSHLQLEIDLNPEAPSQSKKEHIEIIYNKAFGSVPSVTAGVDVAACGDYITSRERAGKYPASPVGAIIHWVHASTNPMKHSHGFLYIDGVLYGQNEPNDNRGFFMNPQAVMDLFQLAY